MELQEAIQLFKAKFPDRKIISGYEYDSLFVFSVVSKETSVENEEFFDCQSSVNKKTGEILTFQPWNISIDEYRRGKKIM